MALTFANCLTETIVGGIPIIDGGVIPLGTIAIGGGVTLPFVRIMALPLPFVMNPVSKGLGVTNVVLTPLTSTVLNPTMGFPAATAPAADGNANNAAVTNVATPVGVLISKIFLTSFAALNNSSFVDSLVSSKDNASKVAAIFSPAKGRAPPKAIGNPIRPPTVNCAT